MSFTGNENHDISFTNAAVMTKKYRDNNPGAILGGFFGKTALLALLNQSNCVGISYYYGLDANGNKVLVLAGCDANENDLTGPTNLCKEMSVLCPPHCGTNDILNS